jgi:hypothetical protein
MRRRGGRALLSSGTLVQTAALDRGKQPLLPRRTIPNMVLTELSVSLSSPPGGFTSASASALTIVPDPFERPQVDTVVSEQCPEVGLVVSTGPTYPITKLEGQGRVAHKLKPVIRPSRQPASALVGYTGFRGPPLSGRTTQHQFFAGRKYRNATAFPGCLALRPIHDSGEPSHST